MDSHGATAIAGYWDAAAQTFDDEPDHGLRAPATRAAWVRVLEEWVPLPPSEVLDVGCGTGSLAVLLAQAGHRVTGVDMSPQMVREARAKAEGAGVGARFVVGDASQPPVGDRLFDVVLVRHVVWTLPDPEAALRAWVRRLRPGGRLVLVEGRWAQAAEGAEPYVAGAETLPWNGGVGAEVLTAAVAPLAREVRVVPLGGDADLWGGPVDDERYALLARR